MKENEGELPQYYVTAAHPAIIPPAEWNEVAKELSRRKHSAKSQFTGNAFSGKLICGDCGEAYGPKVWHSNDKYRRVIWQCNAKFRDKSKKMLHAALGGGADKGSIYKGTQPSDR